MAMASLIHRVILVQLLILSVATISATARPCKTLFISSYSFSFKPVNQQNPSSSSSSGFVTVFTEISHFNPKPQVQEQPFPTTTEIFLFRDPIHRNGMPLGYRKPQQPIASYDFSSLRDRTKDILSVVVALLFGVGCGALTAATMYLAWSLFSHRFSSSDYSAFPSSFSDDDDNDDDDVNPKKFGYIKIPAATDSLPAPAPAPAK
ncbi:uncharacterized protein LOC115975913 [Quercus lobata]|uniref:Uncharacterized protein n=1 Tax=Quercus lobata TaxID=97700 RepID=A0A7N2KXX8_QUELO|nr:uncharacterized protein LOC115975913 [Quercus lobata]